MAKIKYIVFSDIHFGSNKNKTTNIANNLLNYLLKNVKVIKDVDVFILAGDVFDRLLTAASLDYIIAVECLTKICMFCRLHNIKLRILEGTPSHDNKQCKILYTVLDELKMDIDFRYITDIEIEYIKELDTHILYIPDEVHHDAKDTLLEVKALMESMNLNQVDIAIMHGAFKYQFPILELASMHEEEEYLSLVKHYISIGHVHGMSTYKRILAQGSFDRLAHNEEEPKGAMYIEIINDRRSYVFIENKDAKIFKTIRIDTEDMIEAIDYIGDILKDIIIDSHIRLNMKKTNPLLKSVRDIYKRFPDYNMMVKVDKDDTHIEVKVDNVLANGNIEVMQITKDNLESLIISELSNKNIIIDMNLFNEELSNVL
jgi:DNA repair exonuclease SbcCD nuclease subunit